MSTSEARMEAVSTGEARMKAAVSASEVRMEAAVCTGDVRKEVVSEQRVGLTCLHVVSCARITSALR